MVNEPFEVVVFFDRVSSVNPDLEDVFDGAPKLFCSLSVLKALDSDKEVVVVC